MPTVDLRMLMRSVAQLRRYPWYVLQARRYARLPGSEPLRLSRLWPVLGDLDASSQTGRSHYFYQDVWALRKLAENPALLHVDVGSRLDGFVGQATVLKTVVFVDIRPVHVVLSGLQVVAGDLVHLPFADASITSLSCLNVLEHVGLGRYGDRLNPYGPRAAAQELTRVLRSGGHLYVSVPVGRAALYFNAHRVLPPRGMLELFPTLRLVEFSGINDHGELVWNVDPEALAGCEFGLGLFHFTRSS